MRPNVDTVIDPDNHGLYVPAELVSPVLQGKQGLLEVAHALTVLNTLSIECNWTTGLHVHVGEA
jgi:hypothetical protein